MLAVYRGLKILFYQFSEDIKSRCFTGVFDEKPADETKPIKPQV